MLAYRYWPFICLLLPLLPSRWSWSDCSSWQYSYWNPGEPDNGGGRGEEHCALLGWGASAGQWNDFPCQSPNYYICAVRLCTRRIQEVTQCRPTAVEVVEPHMEQCLPLFLAMVFYMFKSTKPNASYSKKRPQVWHHLYQPYKWHQPHKSYHGYQPYQYSNW